MYIKHPVQLTWWAVCIRTCCVVSGVLIWFHAIASQYPRDSCGDRVWIGCGVNPRTGVGWEARPKCRRHPGHWRRSWDTRQRAGGVGVWCGGRLCGRGAEGHLAAAVPGVSLQAAGGWDVVILQAPGEEQWTWYEWVNLDLFNRKKWVITFLICLLYYAALSNIPDIFQWTGPDNPFMWDMMTRINQVVAYQVWLKVFPMTSPTCDYTCSSRTWHLRSCTGGRSRHSTSRLAWRAHHYIYTHLEHEGHHVDNSNKSKSMYMTSRDISDSFMD